MHSLLALLLAAGPSLPPSLNMGSGSLSPILGAVDWTSSCSSDATCSATLFAHPGNISVSFVGGAIPCQATSESTPFSLSANRPCVTDHGGSVYATYIEAQLFNQSLNNTSTWVRVGGVTVTPNDVLDPWGVAVANQINGLTTADNLNSYYTAASVPVSGSISAGFYLKKVSAGTLIFSNAASATAGRWDIDLSKVGSGWELISASHPAVTVVAPFSIRSGYDLGCLFRSAADDGLSVQITRPSLQGSPVLNPILPSADTHPTGTGGSSSFVVPTLAGASRLSISAEVTRASWSPADPSAVFGIGTATGGLSGIITGGAFKCSAWDADGGELWTSAALDLITTHRLGCEYTNGRPTAWVDGFAVSTTTGGAGTGIIPVPFSTTVGVGSFGDVAALTGQVSNLAVCKSSMAACDRSKRGFRRAALLSKNLLVLGDSNADHCASNILTSAGGAWSGTNAGVGGERTDQIAARWPNYASSYYGSVAIIAATNDCAQSRTPASILANMQALYSSIVASGGTPVLSTVLPSATYQTCVEAANALIVAWASGAGIPLVDSWTHFVDVDGHSLSATYDNGDGIHLNTLGCIELGTLVAAELP